MNPNNPAHRAAQNNRANQLNTPQNPATKPVVAPSAGEPSGGDKGQGSPDSGA